MDKYKNIRLYKHILKNQNITENGILAYIALTYADIGLYFPYYITFEQLEFMLTGETSSIGNKNRKICKRIENGIIELEHEKIIKIASKDKNGLQIDYRNSNVNFVNEKPFVLIRDYEIRTILLSGEQSKEIILRYFINIIGSLSNDKKAANTDTGYSMTYVGSYNMDTLASLSYISRRTAIRYNQKLVDLGLLYIARSAVMSEKDKGKIEDRVSNCYSRPENSDKADELILKREESFKGKNKTKELDNDANIRIKTRNEHPHIIQFIRNELSIKKEYSPDDIREHYNNCLDINTYIGAKIINIDNNIKKSDDKEQIRKLKHTITLLKEKKYSDDELQEIDKWLKTYKDNDNITGNTDNEENIIEFENTDENDWYSKIEYIDDEEEFIEEEDFERLKLELEENEKEKNEIKPDNNTTASGKSTSKDDTWDWLDEYVKQTENNDKNADAKVGDTDAA